MNEHSLVAVLLLIAATCLTSCVAPELILPTVDNRLISVAQQQNISAQSLTHGREIYLNRCTTCHVAISISQYSIDDWRRIMPRMSDSAHLNSNDTTDVLNYVLTAHRSLNQLAQPPRSEQGG